MKKKRANSGRKGWGSMDIFFIFFPQQTAPSSSSSSSLFKRKTSNHHIHVTRKLQSTIIISLLLIFLILLLFTLSSLEPDNILTPTPSHHRSYAPKPFPRALQRLGTLYTQGTTAMNNLVLCHVTESVTTKQLKLFLRAFHRSGLLSNSDLLFLFDSPNSAPDYFNNVILQENDFFLKVIQAGLMCNGSKPVSDFATSFNLNRFDNMEKREIIWGRRIIRSNNNNNPSLHDCRVSYGSVVGFGVGELDPENSLSGFMDRVPIGFRRWAAYPMILGRVRRHYKHVMLVDVRKVLLLGDPLGRVKTQSPDSVFLVSTNEKNINPAVIMGGTRGIRRLSVAMLTEIVRASMRNKRNNVVNESSLLRRLATNEFTLRRINIVVTLVVEESEVGGFSIANQTIVWRENNGADIDTVVMKRIVRFL